ncbi:MAG: hypothetical protein AMXMBFR33_28030 [Candidatus Xenobia bacterium]
MAGGGFTIFNDGNFRIGLGDANRDGKLDFDFGLRSQQYGGGPFGWGHQGAEIGLNTQRGVYAGADYSNNNMFGSQAGYGRFFGDGVETGHASRDFFGNYNQTYTNTGNHGYTNANAGGNFYTGNYYANQTDMNYWGFRQDAVMGNTWSGAQIGQHSAGNAWGQTSWGTYNPGFVPSYGGNFYQGSGCGCAARFMQF